MNNSYFREKRIEELDILKGIGMLIVVAFHFLDYALDPSIDISAYVNAGLVMSLFFLVSGYTWKPGKSPWQMIKKRVPMLLIAFFICTAVITLLFYGILAAKGLTEEESLGTSIWWLLAGRGLVEMIQPGVYEETLLMLPAEILWFLRQMAVAGVIYYLLVNIAMKNTTIFLLITGALFGVSALLSGFCPQLPWDFQASPALAGCMMLGAWCGQKRLIQRLREKLFHPAVIASAVILLALTILISIWFPSGEGLGRGYFSSEIQHGPDVLAGLAVILLGTMPVAWIVTLIGKTKWLKKPFLWMGEHSLGIFLTHMIIGLSIMVLTGMSKVIFYEETVPYQSARAWGVLFATLVLSCVLAPFIEKLLGRSRKK